MIKDIPLCAYSRYRGQLRQLRPCRISEQSLSAAKTQLIKHAIKTNILKSCANLSLSALCPPCLNRYIPDLSLLLEAVAKHEVVN